MSDNKTIADARGALFDMVSAIGWPTGRPDVQVFVTYGEPLDYKDQEVVALLGIDSIVEEPAEMSNHFRWRRFSTTIGIKVYDPTGTAAEVEVRCFALAEMIQQAIWNDYTIADTVWRAQVVPWDSTGAQAAEGGGWIIFTHLTVACEQWLAIDN